MNKCPRCSERRLESTFQYWRTNNPNKVWAQCSEGHRFQIVDQFYRDKETKGAK